MTMRWFAIFTHPLMELTAEAELRRQGFVTSAPMFWKQMRPHGRPGEKLKRAVFPCYIFSLFDPDSARWRAINGTRGVVRLICRGDSPVPIDPAEMAAVHALIGEDGMADIDKLPTYYVNQLLRLREGVWSGHRGLFVGSDKGVLTLSIDILGREVRITVPESQVTT